MKKTKSIRKPPRPIQVRLIPSSEDSANSAARKAEVQMILAMMFLNLERSNRSESPDHLPTQDPSGPNRYRG